MVVEKMVSRSKKKSEKQANASSTNILRIRKENDYIKRLIDTIPPRYYFDEETCQRLNANKQQKVRIKLGADAKKNRKGKKLSVKTLYKRAKLDPDQHKRVTQIIQETNLEPTCEKNGEIPKLIMPDLDQPLDREEVQKRLQTKIKALRGNRPEGLKDAAAERKKLKRRLSKLKLKEKRRLQKQAENTASISNEKSNATLNSRPAFNKEGKMVFNKFDFSESGLPEKKKSDSIGKDFKQLLVKADKQKQKLETLKMQDPEKAKGLVEKKVWLKVMQKAEGVKVKDDPLLLKKGLKRKEQGKKKSKKRWEARENQVEQKMKDRQKKRQDNIKAKKQETIKKKIKKAIKKGRYIPEN